MYTVFFPVETLGCDDLSSVYLAIREVATQWEYLGLALDINQDLLDQVEHDKDKVIDRLKAVIKLWLTGNGGERTWRFLCVALEDPIVERIDIARKIAEKYVSSIAEQWHTACMHACMW